MKQFKQNIPHDLIQLLETMFFLFIINMGVRVSLCVP